VGKAHKNLKGFWKTIKDILSPEQKEKIILFEIPKVKCNFCDVTEAKWQNIILKDYACDDCVPRGCSCKLKVKEGRKGFSIRDYEYCTDKKGNELPCEDWVRF
jgi:hypothetical protein